MTPRVAAGLSDDDVREVRAEVAAGRPAGVWFTAAAVGVPAGRSARVVAVGEVAEGEFLQVRPAGSKDTVSCSPDELTRTRPPRRRDQAEPEAGRTPRSGRRAADASPSNGLGGSVGGGAAPAGAKGDGPRSRSTQAPAADGSVANGAAPGRRGTAGPAPSARRASEPAADGSGSTEPGAARATGGRGVDAGAPPGRSTLPPAADESLSTSSDPPVAVRAAPGRRAAAPVSDASSPVDAGGAPSRGPGTSDQAVRPGSEAGPARPTGTTGRPRRRTALAAGLTVTLTASAEGEWSVEVRSGTKRVVPPTPVPAAGVAAAARSLPTAVGEAVAASLEEARRQQQERVERLRAELEAAQRVLEEFET